MVLETDDTDTDMIVSAHVSRVLDSVSQTMRNRVQHIGVDVKKKVNTVNNALEHIFDQGLGTCFWNYRWLWALRNVNQYTLNQYFKSQP